MSTLTLMVVVLVVYLAAMLGIGFLGRGTADNFKDYVTAAKKGTLLMVCGSYIGSHIGNGVVVGGAEYGAEYGIGGAWFGVGASLGYIVFAFVVARKLYRANALTISDVLNQRYGKRITGTIYAVVNCFAAMSIMAGQIIAGRNLFSYLGLNPVLGATLVCVVVFIYATVSGQWGVMMTDVIQSIVVVACTLLAILYMAVTGGFGIMKEVLPASSWSVMPFGTEQWVMMLFPSMLYGLVSCASFQRNISAKDEKTAILSALWGGLLLLPFVILPVLIGMYGRALFPDAPASSIMFQVMLEAFPSWLAAILIAALVAAVMSTVDSQLIYITASFTNDIYLEYINHKADDKTLNRIAHIVTFVVGCVVLYLALNAKEIISMLSYAYTFLCAGTLVMFVGGIFWGKATRTGAVAAAAVGIFFVVLYKFCGVNLPYASVFPILPSAIAFVVVSLLTQSQMKTGA